MAAILVDSIVIAAMASANCSPREDIGEMGEGWMAGVKERKVQRKQGMLIGVMRMTWWAKGNSKSQDNCCQDS